MDIISSTNNLYQRTVSLILAVGGNLFLVQLFLNALLFPLEHTDLIFHTGIWIFLMEFLGIISGKFLSGGVGSVRKYQNILGLFIFAVFAFGFSILLQNVYYSIIFIVTLIAKSFGNKAALDHSRTVLNIFILLASLAVVFFVFSPQFWIDFFPFPEAVFNSVSSNSNKLRLHVISSSGEFIDHPQTLLAWGVVYYSLLTMLEVVLFWKNERTPRRSIKVGFR